MLRTLLLLLALAPAALAARAEPPRSEVPIEASVLSDGARRFAVPVQVGSTRLLASLDTGSTGLRILPGVLKPGDAPRNGEPEIYGYASGSRYEGVASAAALTIGGLKGAAAIHLIRTIGCFASRPRCPASRTTLEQYGIASDGLPGEGFKAILGIDMAPARVGNPLRALGVRRWIVELPRQGETAGRLILNPTDAEVEGYAMVPLAAPYVHQRGGGLHDAAPGCLANTATGARACGPVLLDTGGPAFALANARLEGPPWPAGSPIALEIFDARGGLAARAPFTVGDPGLGTRLFFRRDNHMPGTVVYAGVAPYFSFSVLYDARRQMIGLKPRPPPAASAETR